MQYQKKHIYILNRSKKIDKHGRPIIYLAYLGKQSLVWCGTTIKNDKAPDEPLMLSPMVNIMQDILNEILNMKK